MKSNIEHAAIKLHLAFDHLQKRSSMRLSWLCESAILWILKQFCLIFFNNILWLPIAETHSTRSVENYLLYKTAQKRKYKLEKKGETLLT